MLNDTIRADTIYNFCRWKSHYSRVPNKLLIFRFFQPTPTLFGPSAYYFFTFFYHIIIIISVLLLFPLYTSTNIFIVSFVCFILLLCLQLFVKNFFQKNQLSPFENLSIRSVEKTKTKWRRKPTFPTLCLLFPWHRD